MDESKENLPPLGGDKPQGRARWRDLSPDERKKKLRKGRVGFIMVAAVSVFLAAMLFIRFSG